MCMARSLWALVSKTGVSKSLSSSLAHPSLHCPGLLFQNADSALYWDGCWRREALKKKKKLILWKGCREKQQNSESVVTCCAGASCLFPFVLGKLWSWCVEGQKSRGGVEEENFAPKKWKTSSHQGLVLIFHLFRHSSNSSWSLCLVQSSFSMNSSVFSTSSMWKMLANGNPTSYHPPSELREKENTACLLSLALTVIVM